MNSSLQVNDLCDDIIRDIYSFGYPNHRVYMRNTCDSISSTHHPIQEVIQDAWDEEGGGECMSEIIKSQFIPTDILYMFHYYKKCRCCTRHSYYKPDIKCQQFNPKPNYNPHYNRDYTDECACVCRHMSRHLYSAYYR